MIITDKILLQIELDRAYKEYQDLTQFGVSEEMLGVKYDRLDTQAGIKLKDFNTIWNMAIETAAEKAYFVCKNDLYVKELKLEKVCAVEAAGIEYMVLYMRLRAGMPLAKAVKLPIRKYEKVEG